MLLICLCVYAFVYLESNEQKCATYGYIYIQMSTYTHTKFVLKEIGEVSNMHACIPRIHVYAGMVPTLIGYAA